MEVVAERFSTVGFLGEAESGRGMGLKRAGHGLASSRKL